jgi:hypothetical protein
LAVDEDDAEWIPWHVAALARGIWELSIRSAQERFRVEVPLTQAQIEAVRFEESDFLADSRGRWAASPMGGAALKAKGAKAKWGVATKA